MKKETETNSKLSKRILVHEIIGFTVALCMIWATEIFDFSRRIGFLSTPINWTDIAVGTSVVLPLGIYTIYETWRCLKRIKYLEGFLRVCTFCKRILVGNKWVPVEQYIKEHSETEFSHGLCSQCMKEHYGVETED